MTKLYHDSDDICRWRHGVCFTHLSKEPCLFCYDIFITNASVHNRKPALNGFFARYTIAGVWQMAEIRREDEKKLTLHLRGHKR